MASSSIDIGTVRIAQTMHNATPQHAYHATLNAAKLIIGHQPNWPDLMLVTADASSDNDADDDAGINSASAWREVYVFARNCVSSLR